LNNNIKFYLFGGNSKIGNAILNGLIVKYKNHPVDIISIIRNSKGHIPKGKIVLVNNYLEGLNYIDQKDKKSKNIFILSFGVLKSESKEVSYSENLKFHLEINTFQILEIFKSIIKKKEFTEIHIVSSILADFIRPSISSYCLSKNLLDVFIYEQLNKTSRKKIYIWKPAFVDSDLNKNRKPTFLKTSSDEIEKYISKKYEGGTYYIPFYSRYLTILAKKLNFFVRIIDKRY
tara:strand:- start:1563 stop:2258 length:696 start_codon:yes stop_codon:yes gene_type:complete